MKPLPITTQNWRDAVKLLCEGFPERDEAFWQRGLDRWSSLVGDPFAHSIGYLTKDKAGAFQSVLLTFNSPATDRAQLRTNFSSWYVKTESRSRSPLVLKKLSNDENTTYTDFTPSESVRHILRRLRYSEYQAVHVGFWTPLLALSKGQNVVGEAATREFASHDQYLNRAIGDHIKLGCVVLGLQTKAGIQPIVLRLKKRKRIVTSAEVIYCEDVRALEAHLPALCRQLLKQGVFILECDLPRVPRQHTPTFNWGDVSHFVKGSWNEFQIDSLYSEIPILGV